MQLFLPKATNRDFMSISVHEDFGGVSYGAGVDIEVKQDLSTNIEYIHYFDTVGIELTGFSVGLTKAFNDVADLDKGTH